MTPQPRLHRRRSLGIRSEKWNEPAAGWSSTRNKNPCGVEIVDMTLNIAPGTVLILVLGLLVILAGIGWAARIIGQDAARSVIDEYDWDSEDDENLLADIDRLTSDNVILANERDAFAEKYRNVIFQNLETPPLEYTDPDEEPIRLYCEFHRDIALDANGHCLYFEDTEHAKPEPQGVVAILQNLDTPLPMYCNVHSDVLLDARGHCPFFEDAAKAGAYHE